MEFVSRRTILSFFPVLLFSVRKLNKKFIFYILLLLTLGSLTLCQIASVYYKTANFYLLPTRFWELSIGAIAAFKITDIRSKVNLKYNELYGFIGLIFVLFSIFYFNETTPFPSLYTLFPTFGALLIIVFAKPNTKVGFILSNKLVVFLGLLSYSAYLIHQPLISFSKIFSMMGSGKEV